LEPLLVALQNTPTGRFYLFGPPGTGKTAFVRWVAQQLGRPLMVRRASDLMSKWVGGNEKNIATAFTHASLDGAVLLIDEVDTFLQPRQNAVRGWEASMVNEMLTQMETFHGVFFATTNLMQRMDAAAMRRFDVKVHFRAPTATQLQALLAHVTQTMQLEHPSLAACQRLAKLGITPGDLATVVRRARYVQPATTAALLAAVEAEGQFKPEAGNHPMGFI
jgi:SpoVK/Ycf46/Vps4 family AAA+-type ATPase